MRNLETVCGACIFRDRDRAEKPCDICLLDFTKFVGITCESCSYAYTANIVDHKTKKMVGRLFCSRTGQMIRTGGFCDRWKAKGGKSIES